MSVKTHLFYRHPAFSDQKLIITCFSATYRKDSDNTVIFSQTLQTTSSPVNFTVTQIPLNEIGTVTVEVKSKSKPTNVATKSFKLVRK